MREGCLIGIPNPEVLKRQSCPSNRSCSSCFGFWRYTKKAQRGTLCPFVNAGCEDSDPRCSASHEEGDDAENQEDEEQNLRDFRSRAGDAGKAQQAGDDGDNEE